MRKVNSVKDIKFTSNDQVEFEATVIDIVMEGSEENKSPFRALVKFEDSGERIQIVSWNFKILQTFKDAVETLDVFRMESVGGRYRDEDQLRVDELRNTGKQSTKKILKVIDILGIKREFNAILNQYIATPLIRNMLDTLVIGDEDFFTWPAATRVHHNYKGGLAVHTLQVVNHAIALWKNYRGQDLDIEVIIAGAMLHDIGKLSEYNQDGSRTTFGDLISHLVDGVERVTDFCSLSGVSANNDRQILVIKHIILSHHEKLEFGSPNRPAVLEAMLVARADALDAAMEGIYKELENTEPNEFTDRVWATDGQKFLKW